GWESLSRQAACCSFLDGLREHLQLGSLRAIEYLADVRSLDRKRMRAHSERASDGPGRSGDDDLREEPPRGQLRADTPPGALGCKAALAQGVTHEATECRLARSVPGNSATEEPVAAHRLVR